MKTLKLWNGRGFDCRHTHLYVAAYSVADAVRVANEAFRKLNGYEDRPDMSRVTAHEVRVYWSEGCWGNAMDGITPERGVWQTNNEFGRTAEERKPVRLI